MYNEPIELWPAFGYDCPNCGRENFVRGVVPSLSPEDVEDLAEEFGLDEDDHGAFMCMPTEVICPHCGESYPTVHYPSQL